MIWRLSIENILTSITGLVARGSRKFKGDHDIKKIGVLTFHRTVNYVVVLQAYALKSVLTKLGTQCSIIDHKNQQIEKINRVKLFDFKSTRSFIKAVIYYPSKRQKYKKFSEFRKRYLNPEEDNTNNDLQHQYDGFIVGTDQVWNYELSKFDTAYFLDFVTDSKKKISYAASFGLLDIPTEHIEKYRRLLKDFNKISVREEQGAKIINAILERDVP